MVTFGIKVHQGIQKLVGGSYPNHALPLPESGEEILDLNDFFKDKDTKQCLPASELQICTVVLQSCPVGHSPMFYLLDQPQNKNKNSGSNERCVQKCILSAFEACKEEVNNAIFLGVSVDGVSYDSKFVRSSFFFIPFGDS